MKIVTFGCRLNTFESTVIQKVAADLDDVFVVNTCAVTGEAERQCRQTIRKIHRDFPEMKIIVTGCAAQLHPEEYARMPEVFRVLGNREKLTREALFALDEVMVGDLSQTDFDLPVISDFEGRTRAFLQIQQGCNHACTFCIIHKARGKNIGLEPDLVVAEARRFVENGFSELVLTGVDITSYPYGFNQLIKRLVREVDGLKRLRLGSVDPACIDDELIDLFGDSSLLMPYLHLSIQAGDDLILKRMGRRHRFEQVLIACLKLKELRPDMVFGADFIAGFPTETQEQFERSCQLVKDANITHLHVFPYSVRPGTPAAKMPMVDMFCRKERARQLRLLGEKLYGRLLDNQIGQTHFVLIEKEGCGYSENYLKVQTKSNKVGEIIPVKITERKENELVGEA